MNSKFKEKGKFADQDFIVGLVFLVISILGYYYAHVYISNDTSSGLPPEFYPKSLFIILGASAIGLMYKGYKRTDKKPLPKYNWRMIAITIALLFGYSILFEYIGFIISTIIFMVAFMIALGERKPITIIASSLITTFTIYLLFTKAFMIIIPA